MPQLGKRSCGWCLRVLETKVARPKKVYCSTGCRDADHLFEEMFSDEEINRRIHYAYLTSGNHPPDEGDT